MNESQIILLIIVFLAMMLLFVGIFYIFSKTTDNKDNIEINKKNIFKNLKVDNDTREKLGSFLNTIDTKFKELNEDIESINDDITEIHEKIKQIETNKTNIETNKTSIETNKTGIETNKTDIQTNKTGIATNLDSINTLNNHTHSPTSGSGVTTR